MRFHPPRPLLAVLAAAFAASLLLYSGIWMVTAQSEVQPEVELGFSTDYQSAERAQLVTAVYSNSPAKRAGLLPGDRLVAIDGMRITDERFETRIWMQHRPGDQIHLTIQRPGTDGLLFLTGTFRRRASPSGTDIFSRQLNILFPVPFVIVGLAVLFFRLEDLNAWLLALLFGGVVVSRGLPPISPQPGWWPVAMAYQAVMVGMVGPFFYWFYAGFPARSVDRRWPWLKWVCLGLGLAVALGGIRDGRVRLSVPFTNLWGEGVALRIAVLFVIACLTLGLVSFAANFFSTHDPETRRKTRIMFWGTVVGLGPNLVKLMIQNFTGYLLPGWLNDSLSALLFLLPMAFAYAVVVHRVLEIPVLLKRSARYLLVQRGFTILLSLVSIGLTLLFALSFPYYLHSTMAVSQAHGIALGAIFGTALLWTGTQVHRRVSGKIDRAFFRSAYDARMILEDLAEKTRTATDRTELARLLEFHLLEALKPRFLSVQLQPGAAPPEEQPECVVRIQDRDGRQLGTLLVGPRLSEEPYSSEDRRLLASVASQTATALENMHLAEEIAERIAKERRAAREMEIAREVQARLLPQAPPQLQTLECAARCVQARAVGGDYYDFLDLGPDRAGLVLADVSGKGVHAALLVAHLEAYLRSQSSKAPFEPVGVLEQVNQMLYLSTAPEHYATVFLGIYSDQERELLYVNCGHNPPVWLRQDGSVTRLGATATVVGAFDRWHGLACRVPLNPGDLLAVFSDGITEAAHGEEEFGEQRLIEELLARNSSSVDAILSGILGRVQEFCDGAQSDDLTLLVARAR